jgi:hypothetical protein
MVVTHTVLEEKGTKECALDNLKEIKESQVCNRAGS